MFTTCPQCQTDFPVDFAQLRAARGTVCCGECNLNFNALSTLRQTEAKGEAGETGLVAASSIPMLQIRQIESVATPETASAPWEAKTGHPERSGQWLWALGTIATLLVGGYQFYSFEAKRNFSNPTTRPLFELACEQIGCNLPAQKSLESIRVVNSNFDKRPDKIELAIQLVSETEQPYPDLKLSLTDIKNNTVAQRILSADEYLTAGDKTTLLTNEAPTEIKLQIVTPEQEVESFIFELL